MSAYNRLQGKVAGGGDGKSKLLCKESRSKLSIFPDVLLLYVYARMTFTSNKKPIYSLSKRQSKSTTDPLDNVIHFIA